MSWNNNIIHGQGFGVDNPTQNYPTYPNYANSDDIYLDDRTRPRDEYGFRLQPGRQMDKWNFRDSNKDVLEYLSIAGGKEVTGTSTANLSSQNAVKIPLYMDNTGKFKADNWSVYYYTEKDLESISKGQRYGKIFGGFEDGYIIVPDNGIYMIQYYCQFNWQQGTSTTYSTAPKLFAQLSYFDENGTKSILEYIYSWGVVNPDLLTGININLLDKGYKLGLDVLHSRDGVKAFCRGGIKITKLS